MNFLRENDLFLKVRNINKRIVFLSDVTKTRNGGRGYKHGERANEKWEQNLTWTLESPISDFISNSLFCSHFSFFPVPRFSNIPFEATVKIIKSSFRNKEKETLFSLTFLSNISLDPLWRTSRKTVMIDKVSWKKCGIKGKKMFN